MERSYPILIGRFRWRSIYVLCAIVCLIVTGEAHAAEAARAKRVLLISTGTRFSILGTGADFRKPFEGKALLDAIREAIKLH